MSYTYECKSGALIVSDPSYEKSHATSTGEWKLSQKVGRAKRGRWIADLTIGEIGDWGLRVKRLVTHIGNDITGKVEESSICVDSGRVIVADESFYPEKFDEKFDEQCNNATDEKFGGIVEQRGVVTRSGIGDGMYEMAVTRNRAGEAIKVDINFVRSHIPNLADLETE